jgi:hypothetical protein
MGEKGRSVLQTGETEQTTLNPLEKGRDLRLGPHGLAAAAPRSSWR